MQTRGTEMESVVEKGSHAIMPQLTTSKGALTAKRARFEASNCALRPQTALVFTQSQSDTLALASPIGSVAFGTSSGGSSERYSREGIAGVVPSNVLVKNLLMFSL